MSNARRVDHCGIGVSPLATARVNANVPLGLMLDKEPRRTSLAPATATARLSAPMPESEPRKPGRGDLPRRRPLAILRDMVDPVLGWMRPAEPLELQILGRTLLHAALVGLGAGIIGAGFFAGVQRLQTFLLEHLAGYELLIAKGEPGSHHTASTLHLWMVLLIPAGGALIGGFLTRFAPECRGGGGDATIDAFHRDNGVIRRRVLLIKPLASIATLGSGGSGGREGPTMQIGAALGSVVGRYLRVSARERRVLMVAGVAAGISAVFRTPLGAALLAIEMLYRDDFESEALIPAVLASVIAYSVSITVFGQSTLFGDIAHQVFRPAHIPLYILLAIVISMVALVFIATLRAVQRIARALPLVEWARPAVGGLALGVFVVLVIHFLGPLIGRADQGLGILGGGYGGAQVAISGADWVPIGWRGVQILLALAFAKIIATALTIGSGGSAGDFAPTLAIGGMIGGAFGLAAQLVVGDQTIHPGAFALVGMATFYGGIAKTPVAALVFVCELAGSYDLLVPLMLAEAVAFVALRRVALYHAQPRTVHESAVHRHERDPMRRLTCRDVLVARPFVALAPSTPGTELTRLAEEAADQDVFPVLGEGGQLVGVLTAESLRVVASNPELQQLMVAVDLMRPPISIRLQDDLRTAAQLMVAHDLRTLPVLDDHGAVIGLLDEHDISSAILTALGPPG